MSEIDISRAHILDGIAHGFLGRRGGVSTGEYASLNVGLGSEDDPAAIRENRRRAANAVLPGAELATLYQVHSADAVIVDAAYSDQDRPHADALVTDRPNLVLGILTADCVPVLFADRERGVVGAAHAGWKGALAGVTDNTIAMMEKLGADRTRIVAAIGPCIARASYEVSDEFRKIFEAAAPENERFFISGRAEHYQFDIEAYVVSRLAAAGIAKVEAMGLDTYAAPDRFYSYRRSCHLGETGYGRQISMIAL